MMHLRRLSLRSVGRLVYCRSKSNISNISPITRIFSEMISKPHYYENIKSDVILMIEETFVAKNYVDTAKNEVVAANKDVVAANKDLVAAKNEVVVSKNEVVAAKNEVVAANKIAESARTDYMNLKIELMEANRMILQANGLLSVRGALEFCRAKISNPKKVLKYTDPVDKIFETLVHDRKFQLTFADICSRKKAAGTYAHKALANIWNQASKHYHGSEHALFIRAADFSADECLVLVAIFTHFLVPYKYLNRSDIEVDFFL